MTEHLYNRLKKITTDRIPELYIRPWVDTDMEVVEELIERDCYGIKRLISCGGYKTTIIDIGAHIGVFSILCARVYHATQIIAIEPFPENWQLFTLNTLPYANIHGINAAIVPSGSTRAPYLSTQWHEAANRVEYNDGIPVLGITVLDVLKLIDSDNDIILKTDCEGMELTILKELLPVKKPIMIVGEWHNNKDAVMELLAKDYNVIGKDSKSGETGLFSAVLK